MYRSQITRQMLFQYLLSLVGFIIVFTLLFFIAFKITSSIIWYDTDPLYRVLKWIKDYILIVIGFIGFVGWILITYHFISKPLRYLDEVIDASEQLANLSETPISLSFPMKSVQDELNLVREDALRNAILAKESDQRKNDLVVYLAHDLKTPLTSIIGYLTLLCDEQQISDELREKYLSIALDKAERLEDLINEFFEITRFNISNIELEYSRVNLNRFLEQLIFEFKPILSDKGLECTLGIDSDIMMRCDANKLQRVFDNLLRNAVFYSFENSTIEITAIQTETDILIKFTNSGKTIPKEKLDRIFEQFYRLDSSRSSNNGGAGLGLAIAKEIIELHYGNITAYSEDERIEFKVAIPLS